MSKPPHPANPKSPPAPLRWARAFFSHQLRVRRGANGLRLSLEDPSQHSTTGPGGEAVVEAPVSMLRELTVLLNTAPGSRTALRHLAAVERGLKRKDADALFLFDIDLPQLQVALRQLASFGIESPTPGLALLSTRLLDAIAAQEARARQPDSSHAISSFLVDDKLEVAEGRLSTFDHLWKNQHSKPPEGRGS